MTPIHAKMLTAIRDNTVDGVPPTYKVLARKMGWASAANVVRVLLLMREAGLVDWDRQRARSLRILTDGPSRVAMERWSDDEVRRVTNDLLMIRSERNLAKGRAAA